MIDVELCYRVAALTQSTGVMRFDADPEAALAIEKAWRLRNLLSKVRFSKNFSFSLSAEGAVRGGTDLATQLYEAIQDDCFAARRIWRQGQFEPRLTSFWEGLASHSVLVQMHSQQPLPYCGWPTPAPDLSPQIAAGLNDFVQQLNSRWASKQFKTRVAAHQSVYAKRVERISSRLEQFMVGYPGSSWISLSVWFTVTATTSPAPYARGIAKSCSVVTNAIRDSVSDGGPVVLLRPVLQRDGWIRVDAALTWPNMHFVGREPLAQRILAECERKSGAIGLARLAAQHEVDTCRIYAPALGHWEAARRLALYFGGADLAVSHCTLKDSQLFLLNPKLVPPTHFAQPSLPGSAWPFPNSGEFQSGGI